MREVAQRAAISTAYRFCTGISALLPGPGQERARELGFYMQKYCGCVFS